MLRIILLGVLALAPASAPRGGPVDFRKLQALVPDKLGGIARTSNEGHRITHDHLDLTQVTAQFDPDKGNESVARITLEFVDYGRELTQEMTAWRKLKIDDQGNDRRQRTLTIAGMPAVETFQRDELRGQVEILVAARFYVSISTQNIPRGELESLANSLPITQLADLK